MSGLIIKEFNGKQIRVREDGYFSATDMCQSVNKLFADWYRSKFAEEYLRELELVMGIPITNLMQVIQGIRQGGTPQDQGTWVHPRVAIRLAQWCSPRFAVQVDEWVEELLLRKSNTSHQPKALPESVTAEVVKVYTESINSFRNNGSPKIAALLESHFGNLLEASLGKTLPTSGDDSGLLESVVECAIRLGFDVPPNFQAALGKYVKTYCADLVQGKNRRFSGTSYVEVPANVYPYGDPEVERIVTDYCVSKAFRNRNIN